MFLFQGAELFPKVLTEVKINFYREFITKMWKKMEELIVSRVCR